MLQDRAWHPGKASWLLAATIVVPQGVMREPHSDLAQTVSDLLYDLRQATFSLWPVFPRLSPGSHLALISPFSGTFSLLPPF